MPDHSPWSTSPLTIDRIDQAYPLLLASDPNLTLDAWRVMARDHLDRSSEDAGIVTLRRGGYIHGLFCYHVERGAAAGGEMRVDVVRFLDIVDQRNADRLMRTAMADIARRTGCVVLRLPMGSECLAPAPDDGRQDGQPGAAAVETLYPGTGSGAAHRDANTKSRRKG